MRMKLWRCIAVHRPGAIVLELRHNPFAGRLRSMIAANARLYGRFELIKGYAHALPVGLPDSLICSHKGGERYALWSAERGVPAGTMFHRRHQFPAFVLV
jgi:hypothetical protein